jgi:hypothetical protein
MSEDRDTWPPQVGQRVLIKPTGVVGTVIELLTDDRVAVSPELEAGTFFATVRYTNMDEIREEWALNDLRPEYPHLVSEWRGTLE